MNLPRVGFIFRRAGSYPHPDVGVEMGLRPHDGRPWEPKYQCIRQHRLHPEEPIVSQDRTARRRTPESGPTRAIAALSLISAPVVMAVSEVIRFRVEQGTYSGTTEHLAAIAASPGLWNVMTVLDMIAVVLFVPAVLGLVRLTRDKAPVLSHLGGGLALVGCLGLAAHNAFAFVVDAALAQVAAREQMVEVTAELDQQPTFLVLLLMILVGFVLGLAMLGAALYRSRTAPRYAAAAIVVGILVFGNAGESLWLTLVASGLLVVGMGSAGLHLLRLPESQRAGDNAVPREVVDARVEGDRDEVRS